MKLQVLMMLFPFDHLHLTQIRLSSNNSFWALLLISILGQFVVPTDKRNLAKFEPHTIYSFSIIIKAILSNFGHVGMVNYAHNSFFQILGMWNSSNYFYFVLLNPFDNTLSMYVIILYHTSCWFTSHVQIEIFNRSIQTIKPEGSFVCFKYYCTF